MLRVLRLRIYVGRRLRERPEQGIADHGRKVLRPGLHQQLAHLYGGAWPTKGLEQQALANVLVGLVGVPEVCVHYGGALPRAEAAAEGDADIGGGWQAVYGAGQERIQAAVHQAWTAASALLMVSGARVGEAVGYRRTEQRADAAARVVDGIAAPPERRRLHTNFCYGKTNGAKKTATPV